MRARKIFGGDQLHGGHFHRRWQQVVHEIGRQGLAVFAVNEFFEQRAADALSQTAGHLAFDDHRIDFSADVFADEVVENFDLVSFLVYFARADMYAVGKRTLVGGKEVLFANARRETAPKRNAGQGESVEIARI